MSCIQKIRGVPRLGGWSESRPVSQMTHPGYTGANRDFGGRKWPASQMTHGGQMRGIRAFHHPRQIPNCWEFGGGEMTDQVTQHGESVEGGAGSRQGGCGDGRAARLSGASRR